MAASPFPTSPHTCKHFQLRVAEAFDQPEPVRCIECHKPFALADASAHVRELESQLEVLRAEWVDAPMERNLKAPNDVKYSSLCINYAIAGYIDGDTGEERFAIPDLDISQSVDSRCNAGEVLHDLVHIAMVEWAEQGLLPPSPRDIPQLQELYPSYSDWEWSWLPVDVKDCLNECASRT